MAHKRRARPPLSSVAQAPLKDALPVVLEAWRHTRHPRLGELADLVSAQLLAQAPRPPLGGSKKRADVTAWEALEQQREPLDFERLVAAARAGTQADVLRQVRALARWEDARLGAGLLRLLEKPPYAGVASRALLAAILELLEQTGDPRLVVSARALSGRYLGIVNSSTGGWVAGELAALAQRLEALPAPALSEADAAACAALEERLGPQVADRLRARKATSQDLRGLSVLFDAVYAAPQDDGPRLVLADALMERDDPRGEFITLQLARARGTQTPAQAQREAAFLKNGPQQAQWAQPLSHAGECEFERGFPVAVRLYRGAEKFAEEPCWSTVRRVEQLERLSHKGALKLLQGPALRGLQVVKGVAAQVINALEEAPRPWTELLVVGAHLLAEDSLKRVPGLQRLDCQVSGPLPDGLFAPLEELRSLRLRCDAQAVIAHELLTPLRRLESADLVVPALSRSLAWPEPLTTLRLVAEALPQGFVFPPGLRSLEAHCDRLAEAGGAPLQGLREARLVLKHATRAGLAPFSQVPKLRLELFNNPEADALQHLGGLRALELRLPFAATPRPGLLDGLTSLEHLELRASTVTGDSFRGLGRLKRLVLELKSDTPVDAFEHLPLLEVLACPPLDDGAQALERLSHLRELRCLDLPLTSVPTRQYDFLALWVGEEVEGLGALLARLPGLRRLGLHLAASALDPEARWSSRTSTYVKRDPADVVAAWQTFAALLERSGVRRCELNTHLALERDDGGPFVRCLLSASSPEGAFPARVQAAFPALQMIPVEAWTF